MCCFALLWSSHQACWSSGSATVRPGLTGSYVTFLMSRTLRTSGTSLIGKASGSRLARFVTHACSMAKVTGTGKLTDSLPCPSRGNSRIVAQVHGTASGRRGFLGSRFYYRGRSIIPIIMRKRQADRLPTDQCPRCGCVRWLYQRTRPKFLDDPACCMGVQEWGQHCFCTNLQKHF